jgi:chorismate dehydratase
MTRVRLGAVGYLNARPLVHGLERSTRFDLRFDVPSRCADLLHRDHIDVGLIPTIEYLRGPSEAWHSDGYRVVPDLAIASRGPVASVALYTTGPVSDVRAIAMDTSSRTSVALVRVLCARSFGIDPALEPRGPDLASMLTSCDAALLIGDNALFQGSGQVMAHARQVTVQKIDLGEVWTAMTGLPFVWAFWAGRPDRLTAGDLQALRQARDAGVTASEPIARQYLADRPERQAAGARYLRDNIKYYLGPDERAGLELFYRYAADAGVVDSVEPLRFY